MPVYRINRRLLLIVTSAFLLIVFIGWLNILLQINCNESKPNFLLLHRLKTFSEDPKLWHKKDGSCFGLSPGKTLSVGILDDVIKQWSTSSSPECRELYQKFTTIYSVTKRSGQVVIPDTFREKVLSWLDNDEKLVKEVERQSITEIFNKYTHESTIFNPLRCRRPGINTTEDLKKYVEKLSKESEKDCDFCVYRSKTAEDTFGRIESKYSATASNTFKYDGYHALIMLKTHNPIEFNEVQFLDMMDTAMKWFMKVYEVDRNYKYPHLMWDCLPKGSASQIHPHAQASVEPVRHYGLMEHIHLSAIQYSKDNGGNNYFSDLIQVHSVLGLTTTLGNATAMAYITPKKDNEVMIMSKHASEDFFRLLYYTIRAYMDDMELYAWSLAMFLPKLEPYSSPRTDDIPAIVRIISRGPANNPRSDISAMELFAASNVNIDPFGVIDHVTKSIEKRSGKKNIDKENGRKTKDEKANKLNS